jgi:hypothetical protein
MKTLIILVIASLCLSTSCKKEQGCRGRDYTLEHPMSLYPVKESYNVGDTFWVEMNFPDVFTLRYPNLQNTNEYFTTTAKLENFNFHRNFLSIFELSDFTTNVAGQTKGAWHESFDAVFEVGESLGNFPDGPQYKLSYGQNAYKLRVAHVLKKAGIYLFNPIFFHNYPNSSFGANEQDITPECKTKEMIYDIEFPINRQSDGSYLTNYHIFEQHMNPALETDLDRIKNRCFTFKVN